MDDCVDCGDDSCGGAGGGAAGVRPGIGVWACGVEHALVPLATGGGGLGGIVVVVVVVVGVGGGGIVVGIVVVGIVVVEIVVVVEGGIAVVVEGGVAVVGVDVPPVPALASSSFAVVRSIGGLTYMQEC